MSIAAKTEARVKDVSVTDDLITFHLVDGRVISVPLAWSWRLTAHNQTRIVALPWLLS